MSWTSGQQAFETARLMLHPEAGEKLSPAAVIETCEVCGDSLTERGHINGLGVLECMPCRLPYVRGGVIKLAASRPDAIPPETAHADEEPLVRQPKKKSAKQTKTK
jgi:hypothetical protein